MTQRPSKRRRSGTQIFEWSCQQLKIRFCKFTRLIFHIFASLEICCGSNHKAFKRVPSKPYSAFFLGLAGLSSWTHFKTNVAFFQVEHSASFACAGGQVSSSPAANANGTVSANNVMASARLLMKKSRRKHGTSPLCAQHQLTPHV